MGIDARFHPLLLFEYSELVHRDKQSVAVILQSGAIIPLQNKRAQRDDVIKRAPIKSHNEPCNMAFMFVSCTISRNIAVSSSVHTYLIFSSAAIFCLSSWSEAGVTFKSRNFCTSSFIRIHSLNWLLLHFVALTFYQYTNFSSSLNRKNLFAICQDFFEFPVFPLKFPRMEIWIKTGGWKRTQCFLHIHRPTVAHGCCYQQLNISEIC